MYETSNSSLLGWTSRTTWDSGKPVKQYNTKRQDLLQREFVAINPHQKTLCELISNQQENIRIDYPSAQENLRGYEAVLELNGFMMDIKKDDRYNSPVELVVYQKQTQ